MSTTSDQRLSVLRRVTAVRTEPVHLREPFVEVVRRFAHLPGTVAPFIVKDSTPTERALSLTPRMGQHTGA